MPIRYLLQDLVIGDWLSQVRRIPEGKGQEACVLYITHKQTSILTENRSLLSPSK